jgi:hypothetical protein
MQGNSLLEKNLRDFEPRHFANLKPDLEPHQNNAAPQQRLETAERTSTIYTVRK